MSKIIIDQDKQRLDYHLLYKELKEKFDAQSIQLNEQMTTLFQMKREASNQKHQNLQKEKKYIENILEIQKKSDDRLERCIGDKMTNKAMIREFYAQKIKRDEKNAARMIEIDKNEKD